MSKTYSKKRSFHKGKDELMGKKTFLTHNAMVFVLLLFFVFVLCTPAASAPNTDVQAFVIRFYQLCLGRNPDIDGLNNWATSLNSGEITGETLAESFIFSQEFQNQNTSDDEFLTILYQAFFNREPDTGGYDLWMNQLSSGTSRSDVLEGFTSSQEFIALCQQYGITAVEFEDEDNTTTGFVTRFYQECLGREPDSGGLDHWVNSLEDGTKAGDELAEAFVWSSEFESQDTSDSEFLTILYQAFFNREPDSAGYNTWLDSLSGGMSRSDVLDGFTSAQEFFDLCDTYGIIPTFDYDEDEDDIAPTPACINIDGVKFRMMEVRDLSNCGGPSADYEDGWVIGEQNGCSVTFHDEEDIWGYGTISGNQVSVQGVTWYEYGGWVEADYDVTFSSDGSSFEGTATAVWSDSYSSETCTGTIDVYGDRY